MTPPTPDAPAEVVVRGDDGEVVGRIDLAAVPPRIEVLDETQRDRVEQVAAYVTRARAPRPRPSC